MKTYQDLLIKCVLEFVWQDVKADSGEDLPIAVTVISF